MFGFSKKNEETFLEKASKAAKELEAAIKKDAKHKAMVIMVIDDNDGEEGVADGFTAMVGNDRLIQQMLVHAFTEEDEPAYRNFERAMDEVTRIKVMKATRKSSSLARVMRKICEEFAKNHPENDKSENDKPENKNENTNPQNEE